MNDFVCRERLDVWIKLCSAIRPGELLSKQGVVTLSKASHLKTEGNASYTQGRLLFSFLRMLSAHHQILACSALRLLVRFRSACQVEGFNLEDC